MNYESKFISFVTSMLAYNSFDLTNKILIQDLRQHKHLFRNETLGLIILTLGWFMWAQLDP